MLGSAFHTDTHLPFAIWVSGVWCALVAVMVVHCPPLYLFLMAFHVDLNLFSSTWSLIEAHGWTGHIYVYTDRLFVINAIPNFPLVSFIRSGAVLPSGLSFKDHCCRQCKAAPPDATIEPDIGWTPFGCSVLHVLGSYCLTRWGGFLLRMKVCHSHTHHIAICLLMRLI